MVCAGLNKNDIEKWIGITRRSFLFQIRCGLVQERVSLGLAFEVSNIHLDVDFSVLTQVTCPPASHYALFHS